MTAADALALLRSLWNDPETASSSSFDQLLRRAKAKTHPDRNDGDRKLWDQIELAERVLRRAGINSTTWTGL